MLALPLRFTIASTVWLEPTSIRRFRADLLRWFRREQRDLPWRATKDPYRILVSEVMLQQTRVAVVKDRYRDFLRRFPTAAKLAKATEQAVLAAWSGLGYYRRARNLHAAARSIVTWGSFPRSAEELEQLPGVGRYTAAAVASIAFGEPVALVDGNVKRVLQRVAGRELSDDECWNAANQFLAKKAPGDFNQAMMELGAVICLPGEPLCSQCPVATDCSSQGAGSKRKPRARLKAKVSYGLAHRDGRVFLQQRHKSATLMPGMWELPAHEGRGTPMLTVRHSITTTDYMVQVIPRKKEGREGRWVDLRTVERLPLTGLTRKILMKLGLLESFPRGLESSVGKNRKHPAYE
jgi:A/G-specific adenine glycosylase